MRHWEGDLMFTPHKRIFAGKGNLRTEPLCPYLTDDIGYLNFRKSTDTSRRISDFGGYIQAEPTFRTRKSNV